MAALTDNTAKKRVDTVNRTAFILLVDQGQYERGWCNDSGLSLATSKAN